MGASAPLTFMRQARLFASVFDARGWVSDRDRLHRGHRGLSRSRKGSSPFGPPGCIPRKMQLQPWLNPGPAFRLKLKSILADLTDVFDPWERKMISLESEPFVS
jgi:hypothetical protein